MQGTSPIFVSTSAVYAKKIEDDPAAPTNLQSRLEKGGSEACYYCANAIFRGTLARMSKTTRQALQPIRPPRHGIDGRDRPDASLSRQIKNTKMHHQFSFWFADKRLATDHSPFRLG